MDEEAEKEGKGLSREVLSSVLEGGEKEGVGVVYRSQALLSPVL